MKGSEGDVSLSLRKFGSRTAGAAGGGGTRRTLPPAVAGQHPTQAGDGSTFRALDLIGKGGGEECRREQLLVVVVVVSAAYLVPSPSTSESHALPFDHKVSQFWPRSRKPDP